MTEFTITRFANIGGNEDFIIYPTIEILELVDASLIDEPERSQLKDAIMAISTEGLMPAFERLKEIRGLRSKKLPELNRKQLYEDFTVVLWRGYKDRMQKAANLIEPEFNFLFKDDRGFEEGLNVWSAKRPDFAQRAGSFLRKQRQVWQNDLAKFRNHLEHHTNASAKFAHYYNPDQAEATFRSVWLTIADIMAMLISLHMYETVSLVEIPPNQRDPDRPRRFRFVVQGFA